MGAERPRALFSVGHFYRSPSVSHVRREPTRLLDRGHVTSHTAELGVRPVTLFEATPEGECALREWVRSFPGSEQVMIKHPVILKTWLATESDITDVVEALQAHLGTTRRRLDDLIWAQRRSEEVGVSDDSELRFARAVLNYSIRGLYGEMSNIARLHDEISSGTEADPARRVHRTKGAVRRRPPRSVSPRLGNL